MLEHDPGVRVYAMDGALVSEENRVRMLAAWVRGVTRPQFDRNR